MSTTVEIIVGSRHYPIACAEADAPRIHELGEQLAARMAKLQTQMGGLVPDAHLLVLTNLMALDELSDAKGGIIPTPAAVSTPNTDEEKILVQAVAHLTTRVNNIARHLRAA